MTKKKVIHFDFKVKLKSIEQTVPFRFVYCLVSVLEATSELIKWYHLKYYKSQELTELTIKSLGNILDAQDIHL